jgi:hypothetical protein
LAAVWLERLIFFTAQLTVVTETARSPQYRFIQPAGAMTTKNRTDLTLYDRLSRLSFAQAARFLGPDGSKLLMEGGKHDIDIDAQVAGARARRVARR